MGTSFQRITGFALALSLCAFALASEDSETCSNSATCRNPDDLLNVLQTSLSVRRKHGGLKLEKKEDEKAKLTLVDKVKALAELVRDTMPEMKWDAEELLKHVEEDKEQGANGEVLAQFEELMTTVMDAAESETSPKLAAEEGWEVTDEDVADSTEEHDTKEHAVKCEEKKEGAFQGDMMPGGEAQNASFLQLANSGSREFAGKLWKDGVMKYCFEPNLAKNTKIAWDKALVQFGHAIQGVTFKDVGYKSGWGKGGKCWESPAVFVTSSDSSSSCFSFVGELSRESQQLNLASPGCDSVGTAMHEILHALGMAHEQSRPDRAEYVEVDMSNVKQNMRNNFDISPNGDTLRPYDILSLMHYGAKDFAIDSSWPTIKVKAKGYEKYTTNPADYHKYEIGERIGLSQSDCDQLADMYKTIVPWTKAMQLEAATECIDRSKDGAPWKDRNGQGCAVYVGMEKRGEISSCKGFVSGKYCCDCGGGWKIQTWGQKVGGDPAPNPAPAPPPPPPPAPATSTSDSWTCQLSQSQMASYCAPIRNGDYSYPYMAVAGDCSYSWYHSSEQAAVSACTSAAYQTCYLYDQWGSKCFGR